MHFDLGTRWRGVVSFMPQPLYPQGNSPWYPLDRRLGRPQSPSGHDDEEKNSQSLPGIKPQNPDCPAHSPVINRLINTILKDLFIVRHLNFFCAGTME
jgi:hypothetical protein